MLDFCPSCDNSLTMAIEDGVAGQRCMVCRTLRPIPEGVHVIWERLGTAADTEMCRQYVDLSIHHDPTIPIIRTHCPKCERERDVRYVRYGSGLTYLYACPDCSQFWTRAKGGPAETVVPAKSRTEA